jgi:hypothetical protein
MAAAASNYLEGKILDQMLRGTAYTWPTTLYFALLTDSNTASQRRAATVTEVSTGTWTNYARTAVTANTSTFAAAAGDPRTSTNSAAAVAFGTAATSGNVTVTALAIYDASTAGNLLYWCDLTSSQIVANGNVVSIATSAVSISLT